MRLDLTTLNLVLAIEQTRSITRGAEREHLALAAASKRISDLETRLGVQLFERRARGVEPTEACRALVRHIRSLHASLHALESEVVEFARGIKGHLRIAANAGAIAEALPPDLAAFSQAHPQIRISLEDQTSAEVQAAVAEGRADVGVFTTPLLDNRLQTWSYRTGRLAVLVPAAHELAGRESVSFDDLLDHDLVGLHSGAAAQELMMQEAMTRGRTLKAEFVGNDPDTDIALMRIPAQDLTAIPLANSDALQIGDFVVAIGNPFGVGQTVTSGIVSAVGRNNLPGAGFQNFIQTDASINPGNSGGALVNLQGQLVGINTASFNPRGSQTVLNAVCGSAMRMLRIAEGTRSCRVTISIVALISG